VYNVEWKFYAAKINRFVLLSNIFLFINQINCSLQAENGLSRNRSFVENTKNK
jgi:hypothetical protein